MDSHMAQNNNKIKQIFHQVRTTLCILEAGLRGPIARKYTSDFSNKLSSGTYVSQTRQWYCGITACSVELKSTMQSHAHFSRTKEGPPMKPYSKNMAISLIYVTLNVTSGYNIEPQPHSQPQNNAYDDSLSLSRIRRVRCHKQCSPPKRQYYPDDQYAL